jgi:inosine/xanthosine triphosphate pyrophosphatase family protein
VLFVDLMSALRISFITGNAKKLAEVAGMLKGTQLEGVLINQAIDLPEIQGKFHCRPHRTNLFS